jgi:hypothetical protein
MMPDADQIVLATDSFLAGVVLGLVLFVLFWIPGCTE